MPGVQRRTVEVIIAETGGDMAGFPTAKHLASWAGVCPGNDESAGKRRSGRTRKGSKWLRANLIEAATAASRTKDTYLQAQYQRLRARRGHARATIMRQVKLRRNCPVKVGPLRPIGTGSRVSLLRRRAIANPTQSARQGLPARLRRGLPRRVGLSAALPVQTRFGPSVSPCCVSVLAAWVTCGDTAAP